MGNKVFQAIIEELRKARYFSIYVDSTPDISHCDQLTCIVRYVTSTGPVERFLKFINTNGQRHTGEYLADTILTFPEENGIDVENCRGQSYDNASNMSGIYNGMQSWILRKNTLAFYIPCGAHSLNLVGKCSIDVCDEAIRFFDFVQRIYVFLSKSTYRWGLLMQVVKPYKVGIVKSLSDTRWSAHSDAVTALVKGYSQIKEVVELLATDNNQTSECRLQASAIFDNMCLLETGIMAVLWNSLLARFNSISCTIQDSKMDLNTAVELLKSLITFLKEQRSLFDHYEKQGIDLCGNENYRDFSQKRKKRSENISSIVFTPSERFRVETFLIID